MSEVPLYSRHWKTRRSRFQAKKQPLEKVQGPLSESEDQNLILTVVYVPSWLDSGLRLSPEYEPAKEKSTGPNCAQGLTYKKTHPLRTLP